MKFVNFCLKKCIHFVGNIFRWLNISFLRLTGVTIGKNTMISLRAKIDTRRGKVRIGENCHITYGCVILSHDGAAKQIDYSDDGSGTVYIGNNVFIGVNTVVLRNVKIGDNSVIGAGSVVVKDIPANVVAAGNPIRIIKNLSTDIPAKKNLS